MTHVNVNFSEQAYRSLQDLATRRGTSMSEALRQVIAMGVWFDQERSVGNRILVETPVGSVREVLSLSV